MIIRLCLKTVGKTVDSQIEETGTNDTIFAIIVNMLQVKLSEGSPVEIDAKTVVPILTIVLMEQETQSDMT